MKPPPDHGEKSYKGSGRLLGRMALITGGDSGMGRGAAIAYAREGADVAILQYRHAGGGVSRRHELNQGEAMKYIWSSAKSNDLARGTFVSRNRSRNAAHVQKLNEKTKAALTSPESSARSRQASSRGSV